MKVFALPHCNHLAMYVPLPDCWFGEKPGHGHLLPSPSVFVYYSVLTLCEIEADRVHV